ncbi:shufflon system plasmid conjugative transfer pilus tip adhesin PilV [Escherichia coli]|uniref:shufflon system plasmid conjugative transfer pilus tip adhesin PilV n=1 Tax=Escherichia coli TaxID=562 RepID=UPI0006A4192D|nr:shufflon system plasmid conjugative transfer pilus tip adhesin PilV [Escherichia coli]EFP9326685.1 shufflon system plasmid conjugative transfer pilus tip adhesin PilV [Shigella sonnei]HBJ7112139.1 shufflon system plasmid conjugative transfer pilus tip adhesin PilV [Salmonella enterica subsp. enterica serovar Enteritidis]AUN45358.1 shufflon system plasmid conjugative transfer pilus tip adhesin PilV [Escherichia coli]EFM2543689.1 shufflon system plasmid conjugative transfer pilus tip adhesin P
MQKDNDKGFALLEILGGLVVISLLMPLFWSYIEDYLNEMRNQSAAFHADAYNTAARTYIADNNARLHSGTLPATFTADELIRKGYLKGLNRSPFGQSYTTGIRRNTSTGRLEALTCSTGGENIKDDALRSIASLLPGLGGFIGKNGTATGVFGGWTDKPGDYGLSCNGGHIAIVMMGDDLQESDRLYRFQVPGRPELNQMNTAINMGGNNLNNAGNVNGQSATLKGDVTSENGWLITKNDKGWKNITYGGGFTMTDSQWIRAVGGKGIITTGEIKGGKVSGGTVRSDGRLSTGEYLQLDKTAVANTKCSPDGLVGRDSKGAILSCQSGVWRTIGAPDGSYSNLGSHRGTFNGRNNGRGTLFVYASGGNGAGGGDCANTSNLQGYVNGAFIGMNASNNPSYGKTAFISFAVPVGASYQIISRPTQNYACGNGVFSVYAYQM